MSASLSAGLWTFLKQSRFPLGNIAITPGALEALATANQSASMFLARHASGDWGDLGEDDRQENEEAIEAGVRILSSYRTYSDEKIWVITEADRSLTTILLPEEY